MRGRRRWISDYLCLYVSNDHGCNVNLHKEVPQQNT